MLCSIILKNHFCKRLEQLGQNRGFNFGTQSAPHKDQDVKMAATKKLLPSSGSLNVVDEALRGFAAGHPSVELLSASRVVVNKAFDGDQHVALISGGGSGHEPSHIGFVGDGMLAAAVCGGVFASPSPAQVLSAIERVGGKQGVLLLVKNYSGDRINFGLAAERANRKGIRVLMVIIGDDCALSVSTRRTERRGLAGTVFVHKILGHYASQGMLLEDLQQLGTSLVSHLGTSAVALSSCSLPGQAPTFHLGDQDMEVGLGIHGESGLKTMPIQDVDMTVKILVDLIREWPIPKCERIAVLVNNIGGSTDLELGCVVNATLSQLRNEHQCQVMALVSGRLMTSLEMQGLSITLLYLHDERYIEGLASPTAVRAWPGAAVPPEPSLLLSDQVSSSVDASSVDSSSSANELSWLLKVLREAMMALMAAEATLNKMDAQVGDGDCGTTLKVAASAIIQRLNNYNGDKIADLLSDLSHVIESQAGGSSGGLYSIALEAAAATIRSNDVSLSDWSTALNAAIGAIKLYGGADRGDRTMLDALCPAADVLTELAHNKEKRMRFDTASVLRAVADAAVQGAQDTAAITEARAGRSSYIAQDHLKGVPDPGAFAVGLWLRAIADYFDVAPND